jgi:cell fate (sporulation/competence/biofilm development) regulator YlbF (YheA/YmcA/DUF963 family)
MNNELIYYIDNVIKEIETHDAYKALVIQRDLVENNEEITKLINTFKEKESKYNDVKKYGEHYPHLKTIRREFQQAKQALFEHDDVRAYKTLEKTIQGILDDIVIKIQETVSPRVNIKTETRANIKGGLSCKSG